jgi:hypothetical protein
MARTVAEHLVDTLAQAGVRRVYGIVGDSLNPVTDAIRRGGSVGMISGRIPTTRRGHPWATLRAPKRNPMRPLTSSRAGIPTT